jgi:CBS domain-containing protein
MIICPLCDFENIEGVDYCDQCGQPLDDAHLPLPRNAVERGLLVDTVDALSPKTPIVVSAATPVQVVLKLLVERRIGCVFIVANGEPIGVFSERDALLRIGDSAAEVADEPISRFMTPSPQTLLPSTRLAFAVHQMDLGGYRHVPIVGEDGIAVGVISVRDILRYLSSKVSSP